MANRRQFLQASLALSAASSVLIAPIVPATGAAKVALPEATLFVFDNRFAESVAMAQSVGRRVPLAETNGDMTDLWFNHLNAQWKKAPRPLAGVTTSQGLFVLATLAADHRMRVVHRRELGEPLISWMIAPRAVSA